MKKIFIVIGSNDGNIGVYSNKKLAYNRAVEYLSEWDKDSELVLLNLKGNEAKEIQATYSKVCNKFKTHTAVTIHLNNSQDTAEIQEMILNK